MCHSLYQPNNGHEINNMKNTMKIAQITIVRFIYDHHWVYIQMQYFVKGKILQLEPMRFAIHFITLKSLITKKARLKLMFTSK